MTVRIFQGDCRDMLALLPDASVQCIVTSPPYWGLRDYGVADQIGLEQSPDAYVAEMVAVFREVRRVLRDDGTVWLNLGDSYHNLRTHNNGGAPTNTVHVGGSRDGTEGFGRSNRNARISGVKDKDLIGIPWMVAFALRADGWWLRQDNIWAKRNCMPESIRSRTTRAHEYIFQLTKSGDPTFWTHRSLPGVRSQPDPDYRWLDRSNGDAETDQEPEDWRTEKRPDGSKRWRRVNLWEGNDYFYDAVAIEEDGEIAAGTRAAKGSVERAQQANGRPPEYAIYTGKRNKRTVWWEATQPFAEAHFATMPPAIAETCILAGTSERGCCPHCGAPWVRQVGERAQAEGRASGNKKRTPGQDRIAGASPVGRGFPWEASVQTTTGWLPSCTCPSAEPVPCTVLDPFGGAGTTALVADRLGRDAVMIELNPEYCEMARRRLVKDAGLFADIADHEPVMPAVELDSLCEGSPQ